VAENTIYWAHGATGSTPAHGFNLQAADCTYTLTNDESFAVDVTISATDFTSTGNGWTLVTSSPGEDEVILSFCQENDSATTAITTAATTFTTNLAISGSINFDIILETGTFSDTVLKESTVTLTSSQYTGGG
jgi:hypothetical protein